MKENHLPQQKRKRNLSTNTHLLSLAKIHWTTSHPVGMVFIKKQKMLELRI